MNQFNTVILGFLDYCKSIKKLKHESLKDIKCTLNKLTQYLAHKNTGLEIWELNLDDFLGYINYLRAKRERGSGIAKQISQLRSFLTYAWRSGHCTRNVLLNFEIIDQSPQYESRVLTLEEVTELIGATSKETKLKRKERLVILLLYGLGLRTGELCSLKVQDISIEEQNIFVRGKFDIERKIPIPISVWVELLAYIHENKLKKGNLFKTEHKKTQYRITDVGKILKEYVSEAKLEGYITPKVLRHTFASHLIEAGIDVAIISTLMGHKSPSETSAYLHAFERNKKNAIETMNPILEEE